MYSRIVKVIPITSGGEDDDDIQYGIMDQTHNVVMTGFISYDEAEEELAYRKEEEEKIEDFGGRV